MIGVTEGLGQASPTQIIVYDLLIVVNRDLSLFVDRSYCLVEVLPQMIVEDLTTTIEVEEYPQTITVERTT